MSTHDRTYQRWLDHLQHMSAVLIRQLEEGRAPFQRTWKPGERMFPISVVRDREYQSTNAIWLAMTALDAGYKDPRWGTFNQIKAAGGWVRKGEKGVRVMSVRELKGPDGDRGSEGRRNVRVEMGTVFNAEQVRGLPANPPLEPAWDPCEMAERLIRNCGVTICHVSEATPRYNADRDSVRVARKAQFSTREDYCVAVLHELAHASGHTSRMTRDTLVEDRSSSAYAREELRAEIASMMVCTRLGLGYTPQNGAASVRAWIQALHDNPTEIRRATLDAARMTGYLLRGMGRDERPDLSWLPPGPEKRPIPDHAPRPRTVLSGDPIIILGGRLPSPQHAARHDLSVSR